MAAEAANHPKCLISPRTSFCTKPRLTEGYGIAAKRSRGSITRKEKGAGKPAPSRNSRQSRRELALRELEAAEVIELKQKKTTKKICERSVKAVSPLEAACGEIENAGFGSHFLNPELEPS
ncbi:hypothetical protein [Sphingobium yanoikuyae]|uniref:hypothetical protein n=1 Tax=Sphingobium yanoikuyae TaxID=13690 RepID=UPI0012D32332|nr:hypothetical protein [Sphingobium yanoikuyae]MDV3480049.1 hypothetical protein [Sphingobium yanoikuyae]